VEETPIYSSTKRDFTNTSYSLVDLGGRVPLVDLGEEFLWWSIGEFLWWSLGEFLGGALESFLVEHWRSSYGGALVMGSYGGALEMCSCGV
jgi:hypothetical protein